MNTQNNNSSTATKTIDILWGKNPVSVDVKKWVELTDKEGNTFEFAMHRAMTPEGPSKKLWSISYAPLGLAVCSELGTQKGALDRAMELIGGANMTALIAKHKPMEKILNPKATPKADAPTPGNWKEKAVAKALEFGKNGFKILVKTPAQRREFLAWYYEQYPTADGRLYINVIVNAEVKN